MWSLGIAGCFHDDPPVFEEQGANSSATTSLAGVTSTTTIASATTSGTSSTNGGIIDDAVGGSTEVEVATSHGDARGSSEGETAVGDGGSSGGPFESVTSGEAQSSAASHEVEAGGGSDGGSTIVPPRNGTMLELLLDATARAATFDPDAVLTQINAIGIEDTGTVRLAGTTGFVRRWNFGYWNHERERGISVIYMSESWTADYPVVEFPAGNLSELPPIVDPHALPDSDEIVTAFMSAGCHELAGAEDETLLVRYDADYGGNIVQIISSDVTWGATLVGTPWSEWDSC